MVTRYAAAPAGALKFIWRGSGGSRHRLIYDGPPGLKYQPPGKPNTFLHIASAVVEELERRFLPAFQEKAAELALGNPPFPIEPS